MDKKIDLDLVEGLKGNAFDIAKTLLLNLPPKSLYEELRTLKLSILEQKRKAERTIKPIRLLLSPEAFLLLECSSELIYPLGQKNERPSFRDLKCHPSVFPDTDVHPFQFIILG